ncbi:MAG: hypothetical protein IPK82_00385 [Polyangiaceae bacterium]|nr:hypothetical protein [Polyangiaceae bacterium]
MPARLWSRALSLLLLCAAPLVPAIAAANDPPAADTAPAANTAQAAPASGATGAPADNTKSDTGTPKPESKDAAAATGGETKNQPAKSTGSSKPAKKRRGGIHPCMTPDPGFGNYDSWSRAVSMGQMIAPKSGGVRKDGGFDVVIHFHGHEPIRKEFVKTSNGVVLVGIDLGIGSGAYQNGFASPQTFPKLLASIEAEMAKRSGNAKAHVRKLALSAWSAGYGAIDQILRQTGGKNIDSVILLDSLHAGYENEQQKTLKTVQLDPFVAFAKRAASGKTFMFMSHSSIIPPGYASTTEVASYVVQKLGGKPAKAKREDVLGLDMIRKYDKSNFHVRGYEGDDKPDHCAHLGLIAGIMKTHILPRWKTPQAKVASPKQASTVKTPAAKDTKKAGKDDKKQTVKDDKKQPAKDDKKQTVKDDKKGSVQVKKVASKDTKKKSN